MKNNNEFRKFALSNTSLSASVLDGNIKKQNQILSSYGAVNPTIIEERQMNVAVMDVFSRLMMDRIIFLGTDIDDYTSNVIQAQLLF